METALQPILRLLYWTAGAFIVATVIGLATALLLGGTDRRKRRAIYGGVAAMVMVAYAVFVVPRLIGV
jgi:hypothetical protein